jgi:hypothetical protein
MRHKLSIPILLLAWSCSTGPWNTQPGGNAIALPRLIASNLVVAGRPFDTLWLQRSLLLNGATYDSTRSFVDTVHSWVRIIRTGPGAPDTVPYHLAPPLAVVWLPSKPLDTAIHGATYRLEAQITWDSTPNWGAGPTTPAWKVTQLVATTYTPRVFAQGPLLQAPLEALFPTLAASGNAAFQSWAAGTSTSTLDSLAKWNVTASTLDSVGKGLAVYRPIHSGDTVWYIRSADPVVQNGTSIQRSDRAYLAPQTLDLPVFGGELAIQRFDSTRARILDPITKTLDATLGQTSFSSKDSAGYYQPGQWRMIGFTDAYPGGTLAYWPDTAQIKNLDIGYTGLNVFYAFAMDTMYAAFARGQSSTTNVPAYSNIQGGYGYFSGAAVDSVSVFVQSPTADTFSVAALQYTYCLRKFNNVVDSLKKVQITNTNTIGADWIASRPRQCADFVPPP